MYMYHEILRPNIRIHLRQSLWRIHISQYNLGTLIAFSSLLGRGAGTIGATDPYLAKTD